MVERKFTVTNESGEKLVCVEALPQQHPVSPLPVAILCHGFAYYKEEDGIFTGLAARLVEQGYAVYYFDFSGCGESEGNYEHVTLAKLISDLKTIINEITQFSYINIQKLSLVGQSFGTAVIVAAQIKNVERIVLCGAAADMRPVLQGIFPDFNEFGMSSRTDSKGHVTAVGPQLWKDLKHYNLPELIAHFDCPILFVHGERDDIVPLEQGQKLMKSAKNAKLAIVPGSDHGLQPNLDFALAAMSKFFQ